MHAFIKYADKTSVVKLLLEMKGAFIKTKIKVKFNKYKPTNCLNVSNLKNIK